MKRTLRRVLRPFLPRLVAAQPILRGPLRGTHIVTSWHDYPGAILGRTEALLLAWFDQNVRPGETWLDIGAHYGYTALALCRLVGPYGRVFAFEPVLSTAGCLSRTRRINRLDQLTILPLALNDSSRLTVTRLPTIRGMAYQGSIIGDTPELLLEVALDALWEGISGDTPQIDGVKIDVQGMEIAVLRGMRELIRRFRPKLVVEVHHGVDRSDLLDLLESLGYSRQGQPVEPLPGEVTPQYLDDRSYAFVPLPATMETR